MDPIRVRTFFRRIILFTMLAGIVMSAESRELFRDNFGDGNTDGWTRYGGKWSARGVLKVNGGDGYKIVVSDANYADFMYEADVRILSSDGEAGLVFRVTDADVGATAFTGYYVHINAGADRVELGKMGPKGWARIGIRNLPINMNVWYRLKVVAAGAHIQIYVNDNLLNSSPYPKFDAVDDAFASGSIGVRTWFSDAEFDNVLVSAYTPPKPTDTYTNPVKSLTGDPAVLYDDGVYYLYATNSASTSHGFKVFTSTDLIEWTDQGWVLVEDDSWGSREFWAPEVIRKDETYYMYYTVEERICVAGSSSPLGPFKQDIQEPIKPDSIRIDSHVFQDDDGKHYLYYVAFNNGNEIWAAELNDDMRTIEPGTRKLMIAPDREWEKNRANVNEGPYILKHKGIYYLTYSGSHVASSQYGVGYATAAHPLGPWTKYEHNPILKSTSYVHGTGHHGFAPSPDGSELFIVYHTHYDLKTTNPAKRKMAIDRIHFVPQSDGPDVLEMWGPTVSPQLKPRGASDK